MDKQERFQKTKHLGFLEVILNNKLEGLDFLEPKVVTLERKGLGGLDFYNSIYFLSFLLEKQGGYKITDRVDYETETLLAVRKKAGKSFRGCMRGYGEVVEFQRVYNKNGDTSPVYAVINYFNASGECTGMGFGGKLTDLEKRYCEENPGVVQKSPFSYIPYNEIKEKLPTEFAKTVSVILDSGLE